MTLLRAIVVTLLILCVGVGHAGSAAAGCTALGMMGTSATSCDAQIGWNYDTQGRTFTRAGDRVGALDSAAGPKYEYEATLRCDQDNNCGAAAYTCPVRGERRGLMYVAWAYLLDADGQRVNGVAPQRTTYCEYSGESIPLAAVEAAAHEEIRKRLTEPTVQSAPPGKSLVGLLTIYSTPVQPEPSIQVTQPVPGEVRATPVYRWDFGDGLSGLGPGLPYQDGDLPSRLPGKYLGAVYRTPGMKHVTLTVTWNVRFRLEGVLDVPLAPIDFTAAHDKQVTTAKAVLVR